MNYFNYINFIRNSLWSLYGFVDFVISLGGLTQNQFSKLSNIRSDLKYLISDLQKED